jgi:hypothetical protein
MAAKQSIPPRNPENIKESTYKRRHPIGKKSFAPAIAIDVN